MKISKSICRFVLVPTLLVAVGCAKEMSEEQLKRENRDRVVERVSGSIGYFSGSIETQGNQVVPMELNVAVRTSTEGVAATPVVTLKTGLFGGVEVTTSDAIYDSGRSELIAKFGRSGRITLELKGILSSKGFEGTLLGNTSRSHRVNLKRGNSSTQAVRDSVLVYQAKYKRKDGKPYDHLPSLLTLRLNSEKVKSPESFDLDEMPLISLSILFQGQTRVATQATRVAYDPLVSQMEVAISDRVAIRFENLGFPEGQVPANLIPERIVGTIYRDASIEVGTVEAQRISTFPDWAPMPSSFLGCLSMPAAGLTYPVNARLTDTNTELTNPSGIIFPRAPALGLEITILTDEGLPYGRMNFALAESDPMASRMLFRQQRPSSILNLEVLLSGGKSAVLGSDPWNSLTGLMQTPRSSTSANLRPRLTLYPSFTQGQIPPCGTPANRR
ncbi:MAG: hypothetical protein K2X47_08770 [Bdellovibrionales bacterium]|nr:hypothetical protein [Bdellovibrionales bacterium]